MKYHLFSPLHDCVKNRWIIFVYKNPDTCIESWLYHRGSLQVFKKDTTDIPISKRKYILSSTQDGQLTKIWEHSEVSETDAYFMMFDVGSS